MVSPSKLISFIREYKVAEVLKKIYNNPTNSDGYLNLKIKNMLGLSK